MSLEPSNQSSDRAETWHPGFSWVWDSNVQGTLLGRFKCDLEPTASIQPSLHSQCSVLGISLKLLCQQWVLAVSKQASSVHAIETAVASLLSQDKTYCKISIKPGPLIDRDL